MLMMHFSKKKCVFENAFFRKRQTMKFCKKCHRRIVDKFNGPHHAVWDGVKIYRCNIQVVGNDDGPKVVVQHRKGFIKLEVKEIEF